MNGHIVSNHDTEAKDSQILRALQVVHDPRSTNDLRQDASRYLEDIRSSDEAPLHGFGLASSKEQPAIVRHYGLSLIDYAIRYKWSDHTPEQNKALRGWILSLAHGAAPEDPSFITNKIAETWVEMAKRSWALDWIDMDELLVQLWSGSLVQKSLVLTILEALSEEVFGVEDSVAALRGNDLNRACVEIFTPSRVMSEHFPNRENALNLRYGDEGWIARLAYVLDSCVSNGKILEEWQGVVTKILLTLKSVINWIIPNALVVTNILSKLCSCLAVNQITVQLGAMETLYSLYYRSKFSPDDFNNLVIPMFEPNNLGLLKNLYQWLEVNPTEIDDAKYLLLKKFSEIMYNIGRLLGERPTSLPSDNNLAAFLALLLDVAKNPSLQVSIPALHLWAKLLAIEKISKSSATQGLVGDLLETCCQRLVRYEAFPPDSSNPSILFLNEDIETMPERHAFLGNYSRFCTQIVELVVQQQPIDALYHILGQADQVLDHIYDGEPPFQPATYTKTSIPFLKIDAQFSVIEAALKGCSKWLASPESPGVEHQQNVMTSNLQVWCDRLLGLTFEDPLIKERVIQLAVGFALGPLKRDSQFAVRVFDKILETKCASFPECIAYTDAVRDLHLFYVHQLQRLAMRFADHLVTIYDEVERKTMAVSQSIASDQQTQARYSTILFVIMHRAGTVDVAPREERMQQMVQPVIEQWQDSQLNTSLSSIQGFAELLGMGGLQQYLLSRSVHNISDWSSHPLDDEGKALQVQITNAIDTLPLRATKQFMSVSVEKTMKESQPYNMACRLWQDKLALILPNLLQLIGLSQTFQDPANWSNMPPEMVPVVRRIFTDRFWQVGISQGSRDEFYAQIGGTKSTMEGFASSIRAATRTLRETGYRLLFYMSLLGDQLYGFPDLPGPLSRALFDNACILSPHQMSILVDMVKPIIDNCPQNQHSHFLPPILSALFEQVDRKAIAEWERIVERNRAATEDDDLTTEMKDESILRQLTMASVWLVVGLLDKTKSGANEHTHTARSFILQSPSILKPLLLFCTHVLEMRDTRACSMIIKILRLLVPEFASSTSIATDVREFISTSVLKASITSLNDSYFVELQKDFALLIASILSTYTPHTTTPKEILLSLPGMQADQVERAIRHLLQAQDSPRQQRATVLHLLQGFRGVGVSELGRLPRPDPQRLKKSVMQKQYETANMQQTTGMGNEKRDGSPDLGGVADMFG